MLAAALLGMLGCAGLESKAKVEVTPGTNIANYRGVGVMPFSGRGGRAFAEELCKSLRERGIRTVDVALVEKEVGKIKADAFGLTLFQMMAVRQNTGAEALVVGKVGTKTFSVTMIDLESGDEVVKASFGPKFDDYTPKEVKDKVLAVLTVNAPAEQAEGGGDSWGR